MAGRSGRERLNVAAGDAGPHRPLVLLGSHLVLAALLAIGAVTLVAMPTGDAEFVDVVGLLFAGELILLGVAGLFAAGFGRFGPLLLVDVLAAATVAAGVVRPDALIGGVMTVAAVGLVIAALIGTVVAAVRVRSRAVERWLVVAGLLAIALVFSGSWSALLVALAALCVVAAPDGWWSVVESAPRPSTSTSRRAPPAPDAMAILARRDGTTDEDA